MQVWDTSVNEPSNDLSKMVVKLYPTKPPNQSCLLLAKCLNEVSPRESSENLYTAKGIYDLRFDKDKPAVISVIHAEALDTLLKLCAEAEIAVEFGD